MTKARETEQALLLGVKAAQWLAAPGAVGRVLAAVTNAAYLELDGGEIVWLTRPDLPMHARGIRVSFDMSRLSEGMAFREKDGSLWFGDAGDSGSLESMDGVANQPLAPPRGEPGPRLDVQAPVWHPPAVRATAPREAASACAQQLVDALAAVRASMSDEDATGRELRVFTERKIAAIARAAHDRDSVRVIEEAHELVGLGPGLTPSGDDFVGGLLFAAHHLNAAYPGAFDWEPKAVDDLLEWARPQTNPISHAILRDHAAGEGAEPLHDLFALILKGASVDEAMPSVRRLLAIGSTSGWEMLAGVMAGLQLIADANQV